MGKIDKLTPEQEIKVTEYRSRYWEQAISTEPADRPRAEAAARRLAELAGIKEASVVWVHSPAEKIYGTLGGSFWNALSESLWDSLSGSLNDSLSDSLMDSLNKSLGSALWDSLLGSLAGSSRGLSWLVYYSYAVEVLGIECDLADKLHLHNEIAASCFALWIVSDEIVLCERPKAVKIEDGRLIDLTWRTPKIIF